MARLREAQFRRDAKHQLWSADLGKWKPPQLSVVPFVRAGHSPSRFSRSYRTLFGLQPKEDRSVYKRSTARWPIEVGTAGIATA